MFPWLAFGHMIPYLELAKLIAQNGHKVTFISTPRNINRLPKLPQNLTTLLKYVNLPLPRVDNLPENVEATTDVTYDVVPYLKKAFDLLQQPFAQFLESSNADWVLFDFIPFWVPSVASKLGIKTAFYSIFPAPLMGFLGSPLCLKPLVLLTFLADQGINARVVEEKKMGYSVPRNELDGSFTSDAVAESVRLVMVEEEGRVYRENIKKVKHFFVNEERQERYVDELLSHLRSH
ncbi:hypothetical protein Ahy_A03g011199 isoform B [Arachis hypogaea]|uniref:UDP-glycosyltransferase n=1 Tax=Arachis hypogaea TaxID=3818 RepID=A0A445DPZ3_ARAHY|nr:hypothetical protein Ahy_A03g011199 isoform B [Arachis hypogaea]